MKTSHLADLLSQIQNGQIRQKKRIRIENQSRLCQKVLDCLVQEGWISRWFFEDDKIQINLKYYIGKPILREIGLISKPSRKVYIKYHDLIQHPLYGSLSKKQPNDIIKPHHPLETWVLTTSKGVISGREAIIHKIGGELLCYVR